MSALHARSASALFSNRPLKASLYAGPTHTRNREWHRRCICRAEGRAAPWYLGLVGAGLSFSAAVGSILGGWLPNRFDARVVFLSGAGAIVLSIAACWLGDSHSTWFLAGYCLLGIGLGLLYPVLIGWLNQGEDPHANRRVVSRTLILFCVAWNLGMMSGQLTAGALFPLGRG